MSQNFLYALECLVDDLVITRPNECAPEEYPTCVEISFRSNIFMSVCESNETRLKSFGGGGDNNSRFKSNSSAKKGKSCLFALDKPINENDKLKISIFKKKIEKCKFHIGSAEIEIKNMFDKVTEKFQDINSEALKLYQTNRAKIEEGDNTVHKGHGDFIPASEVTKKLLALFNVNGQQSGNIIIFLRLSCIGPVVTSSFSLRQSGGANLIADNGCLKHHNYQNNLKHTYPSNSNIRNCNRSYNKSIPPYIIEATRKIEGPEEYDEFEAELNGSGITIRVLKNRYQVSQSNDDDDDSDIYYKNGENYKNMKQKGICKTKPLKNNNNINMKDFGKLRKKGQRRSCNLQVDGNDIDYIMKGIKRQPPKGIEVCQKGCSNPDVDVFLLRFGKKKASIGKRNLIEIELKTPKNIIIEDKQKITVDTQIDEETLDKEMSKLNRKVKKRKKKKVKKKI